MTPQSETQSSANHVTVGLEYFFPGDEHNVQLNREMHDDAVHNLLEALWDTHLKSKSPNPGAMPAGSYLVFGSTQRKVLDRADMAYCNLRGDTFGFARNSLPMFTLVIEVREMPVVGTVVRVCTHPMDRDESQNWHLDVLDQRRGLHKVDSGLWVELFDGDKAWVVVENPDQGDSRQVLAVEIRSGAPWFETAEAGTDPVRTPITSEMRTYAADIKKTLVNDKITSNNPWKFLVIAAFADLHAPDHKLEMCKTILRSQDHVYSETNFCLPRGRARSEMALRDNLQQLAPGLIDGWASKGKIFQVARVAYVYGLINEDDFDPEWMDLMKCD